MDNTPKLKPCPFCGSDEIANIEDWGFFYCFCMKCKGRARWAQTRELAAQEWNKRYHNKENEET